MTTPANALQPKDIPLPPSPRIKANPGMPAFLAPPALAPVHPEAAASLHGEDCYVGSKPSSTKAPESSRTKAPSTGRRGRYTTQNSKPAPASLPATSNDAPAAATGLLASLKATFGRVAAAVQGFVSAVMKSVGQAATDALAGMQSLQATVVAELQPWSRKATSKIINGLDFVLATGVQVGEACANFVSAIYAALPSLRRNKQD